MDIGSSRYTSPELLGKGSLGVVYRVFDRLTGTYVALKRIEAPPQEVEMNPLAVSPRWQNMVLANEFRLLASLRHPNIISVLDYGFSDRKPFFVMELLENPQTIVEAGQTQDVRGKVDLLIQMLQALTYLHRHHILHRDLKPTNVLVAAGGQVKVLDFGVAVKRDERQERAGTLLYMAPEVIGGEDASEASDLYAVGVIAYELFTGANPFMADNVPKLLKNILNAMPDARPFEQVAVEHSGIEAVAEVIFRLMAKKPRGRYPDALEAIRALCQATGDPLPPDKGPIRESFLQAARFVGRDIEVNELQLALQEAKEGQGSAWLVGGESGVGKSRLLDELRILAMSEGFQEARGQVAEGDSSASRCWGDMLRPLLLTGPVSDSEAGTLKIVIPDIDALLDREVTLPESSGGHDFYATAAEVLSRIEQPTLLLVEDAQWANEGLEPLRLLLPLLRTIPLLVAGSYRTDESPGLPDQLPGVRTIKLERLTYDDTAELSASMLGNAGTDPNVLEALYKETEGNAIFMVEVIRAWAEEAGQLGDVGQTPLPEAVFTGGMEQIIRRRLSRVPDWAGGLQLAAIMGRELNLPVLGKILSPILNLLTGKDISVSVSTVWREQRGLRLDDWLLVCSDAGILEVYDGKWRFSHDKLREQIYADLNDDQRRVLRGQIARVK